MTTIDYEARMKFCAERIDTIADGLDPCDLVTVLMAIWDAQDSGEPFNEWFERSRLARDILEGTQSNFKRSWHLMHRIAVLEEMGSQYDDERMNEEEGI